MDDIHPRPPFRGTPVALQSLRALAAGSMRWAGVPRAKSEWPRARWQIEPSPAPAFKPLTEHPNCWNDKSTAAGGIAIHQQPLVGRRPNESPDSRPDADWPNNLAAAPEEVELPRSWIPGQRVHLLPRNALRDVPTGVGGEGSGSLQRHHRQVDTSDLPDLASQIVWAPSPLPTSTAVPRARSATCVIRCGLGLPLQITAAER